MNSFPRTAESTLASTVSIYMRQVYQWMTIGLAVTSVVAYGVANSPAIIFICIGVIVQCIFIHSFAKYFNIQLCVICNIYLIV